MKASLVMNVVNIAGNAVLIYVFILEVLGAAIATLIGRILAAIWSLPSSSALTIRCGSFSGRLKA